MCYEYLDCGWCVDGKFDRFQVRIVFHILEALTKHVKINSYFLYSIRSIEKNLETECYTGVWVCLGVSGHKSNIFKPQSNGLHILENIDDEILCGCLHENHRRSLDFEKYSFLDNNLESQQMKVGKVSNYLHNLSRKCYWRKNYWLPSHISWRVPYLLVF